MARITVIPDTRYRTSPSDANMANVIGATEGDPIQLEGAVREGDWWRVPMTLYIRADRASESGVMPWYSQLGIGRRNACGPACDAMMLHAITGKPQSVADLSREIDPGQDGTTSDDLVRLAAKHGVRLKTLALKNGGPVPQLPAICLVKYNFDRRRTYYDPFYGWHWIVLLSYDNDEVVCHDPLFPNVDSLRGAFVRYSLADWLNSFVAYDGVRYAVVQDTSKQSLVRSLLSKSVAQPVSPRSDRIEIY